jgi:hypothetical protein
MHKSMEHNLDAISGEVILTPRMKKTPVWFVIPGVVLAIVSGIVIVTFWDINEFQSDSHFLGILAIPIVLALLVIFGIPPLLNYFSPSVTVMVDKPRAQMGESVAISYRIIGSAQRLRRLRIVFEGAECKWEGHRARGVPKSQTTWRPAREKCFVQEPVLDTSDQAAIEHGRCTVVIPITTVPTLAKNDKSRRIEWWFRVWGDTKFLPNIDERFPIDVEPV